MYYLRINGDEFGFVLEKVHEIKENDISITKKEHSEFFRLQEKGKEFKLKKNPTGNGLFDYIEEMI